MTTIQDQEINTFTKWINSHLKARNLEVNDIFEDLTDGVKLINLYEQISGKKLGKYNKNPKLEIQKVENLEIFLGPIKEFLNDLGIGVQYGSQQIHDKDKTQILGLIFVLITKFVIAGGESESYKKLKNELLKWCQDNTKDYGNVKVTNFTTSWSDGLGFNALLDNFGLCGADYKSLSQDNKLDNINLATETAEKLGIPNLIDADSLSSGQNESISERSQITYLALYRKYMSSLADKKKEQQLKKDMASFQFSAARFLSDVQKQIDEFNNLDVSNASNVETKELGKKLSEYRTGDRKKFGRRETALQMEFFKIQNGRKKQNLEPWTPGEGDITIAQIDAKFDELKKAESDLYHREQDRLRSFDQIIDDFDTEVTEFIHSVEAQLEGEQDIDVEGAVSKLNELVSKYKEFEADELDDHSSSDIDVLVSLVDCLKFESDGSVTESLQAILEEVQKEKEEFESNYKEEEVREEVKQEDIDEIENQ